MALLLTCVSQHRLPRIGSDGVDDMAAIRVRHGRRWVALGAATVVVLASSWTCTSASAATSPSSPATAQAAVASRTALTLVAEGPIGRRSEVTFRATVSPATATGVVRFDFRQMRSGSALVRVVDGRAEFKTNLFDIGTHSAVATFDPDPATGMSGSTSAERAFVVTSNPGLSLSTSAGSALVPGAIVTAGQQVRALAEGFLPGTLVIFTIDGAQVGEVVTVASDGSASELLVLPGTLARGQHPVTVSSGPLTANVVLVVSESGIVVAPPTQRPERSPDSSQISSEDGGGIASSGAHGSQLSHTGGDPIELVLMASVLILVGARLGRVRATRPGRGRHVIANAGGRHHSLVG
ncbi:unannotated protein [freshwater metagenome]|uniref:Unannotated protein n=1 Tax=freshwater metagenome TaxID=449393 RepID=A0A6J7CAW7_9ZZZZ|nr:hypothetical protein [Actinomycetota bacterium]